MMKRKNSIENVKLLVKSFQDERITVRVDLGRNKRIEFCGVLSQVYPALFAVTPDEKDFRGKTVYSYSDVLMGTVKLKKIS
jgi:uncharacterized protein Veg